jgi:hypothetical protein
MYQHLHHASDMVNRDFLFLVSSYKYELTALHKQVLMRRAKEDKAEEGTG